jgi:cystathionine beta-lyase family protein involved in aluminum resistance
MNRREKHNIESNCVTFNDDCYDETVSHVDPHHSMEDAKHNLTGDQLKYLEEKLAVRNG